MDGREKGFVKSNKYVGLKFQNRKRVRFSDVICTSEGGFFCTNLETLIEKTGEAVTGTDHKGSDCTKQRVPG